jgi:N6-L-threonylcarbamoyladenine synthase
MPNKKAPPSTGNPSFDFSFSGIKTAVLRYVETHNMRQSVEVRRKAIAAMGDAKPNIDAVAALCDAQTLDLIASFQYAVVGNLLRQTFAAAESFGARGIVVSGGVAANSELRRRLQAEADRRGLPIAFPSLALSTDNAAMIAAAAWPKFLAEDFAPEDLAATPQLRLGQS